MKILRVIIQLAVLINLSCLFGQFTDITLEDVFLEKKYDPVKLENTAWLETNNSLLFSYSDSVLNDIYYFNKGMSQPELFYSINSFAVDGVQLEIESFQINSTGTYLLIRSEAKRVWRNSRNGIYYLVELANNRISQLSVSNTNLRNAKFSPDGKNVAYVRKNDLYCFKISKSREQQLTNDGSDNIINGQFGWVYEEEFGSADGYRWSPDSKTIAFWREDQTQVQRYLLFDELKQYPTTRSFAYPKVGETNPVVNIGIVDLKRGRTRWMDTDQEYETYIPRIEWTEKRDQLAIMRMNRRQNRVEVLFGNTKTGECALILTDEDSCWVDVTDDWRFLKDGSFLWTSERSGYRHIYHHSENGSLINQLTDGEWEVTEIIALDEKAGNLYFTGKLQSPLEQHFYSVPLTGGDPKKLTTGSGYHKIKDLLDSPFFIDHFSSLSNPGIIYLLDNTGKQLSTLVDSQADLFANLDLTYPDLITVTTSDQSTVLNAKLTLPADFDPQLKYPVIVFGYGGPGSQVVTDRWGGRSYLWHQYLSQQGFICFSIDNRGTGGQGKAFKILAYGDLGNWLVNDQIEGVKYLRSLPYVDADRIGIWGWSGGGYMTAMCLTEGYEYFQVGVAVAPVTDFRLYDTIWTERYMGLLPDNTAGYENASVFNYIDNFSGKLLLIHGTGDDNVHPQNSLKLADAFVKKGKFIDQYYYANKNHSIRGKYTSYNVYKRIADYFIANL